MALPDGVPEELHVACAGRLGLMHVRSQTVIFGGQAMCAPRFEAVCGKGDAKKLLNGIRCQARGADMLSRVVQPASLMALPDGVPEELHVACAGRLGLMNVRSQTVMFGGQAMSASRFEAVCGKGDAKKWKSSLWAASQEGIPEQVRSSRESLLSALTHSLRAESQL